MISVVPLLLLSAWGCVLWATLGLYREVWVGLFPMLMVVPFIDWSWAFGKIDRERSLRLALLAASLFCGLIAWIPPVIYAVGSSENFRWATGFAGACFLIASLSRKPRSVLVVLGVTAVAIALGLVILLSPAPYIDVWSYTQQAIEGLRQGLNPYSLTYPAMYDGVVGHFPYPPLVLFGLAPFEILFGDLRWGYWFYLLLSASALGWRLERRLGGEIALIGVALFLSFPITPFILEQSWTDPFSLALLFCAIACFDRNFRKTALLLLGAFAAAKQYNLLIALPLFSMKLDRKSLVGDLVLTLLIPLLSAVPFLIWDSTAFISSVIHVPVMNQPIFFSLQNWLAHRGMVISDLWAFLSTGILAAMLIIRPRSYLFLGSLFLWMLLFYSHTAANYLWLGLFGLWLSIGENQRGRMPSDWGLFVLSRLLVIFVLLPHLSDLPAYMEHAKDLLDKGLGPYSDLRLEYPPGSLPFFVFPHWLERLTFAGNIFAYRLAFHLMLFVFDSLFFRSLRKFFGAKTAPLLAYIAFTSLLAPLLYDRFDLLIGIGLGWALMAIARGQFTPSALAIGMGTVIKFVPVLWTPILLVTAWEQRVNSKRLVEIALLCLAPMLFAVGFTHYSSGDVSYLTYHAQRGIQIESIYGAAILLLPVLGIWKSSVGVAVNFGAFHLTGVDAYKPFVVAAFAIAMLVTLIWSLINSKRMAFSILAWTLLLAFVLFNRVFSPQFLIWLSVVGCFVLVDLRPERRRAWFALFVLTLTLTTGVFYSYEDLVKGNAVVLTALNLRNVLLLSLLPLTVRWGRRVIS